MTKSGKSCNYYSQIHLISHRLMSHSALCHGILYPQPAPTEYKQANTPANITPHNVTNQLISLLMNAPWL